MRSNLFFTLCMVLFALVFLFMSDQAGALDITSITQGVVIETRGNSIKITEPPNGVVAQIAIDTNTVYDNVQKLTDLKAGDKVQIDYKTDQNKNTALTVTKLETEN